MSANIPGDVIDKKPGNDLAPPLQSLLGGVYLLGVNKEKGGIFSSPDQSVAILEANATALTKWWAAVIAALGSATAVTTAATSFWTNQVVGTRIALIAGAAALIAAAIIAVAMIVCADLRSRATGMAAIYAARAAITREFLATSYGASTGAGGAGAPVASSAIFAQLLDSYSPAGVKR